MAAQKQGKLPIPALPKQAKLIKSIEEKKLDRKEKKKAREKTRIYIGTAHERWRRIKQTKGLKNDAEVALLLLDQ